MVRCHHSNSKRTKRKPRACEEERRWTREIPGAYDSSVVGDEGPDEELGEAREHDDAPEGVDGSDAVSNEADECATSSGREIEHRDRKHGELNNNTPNQLERSVDDVEGRSPGATNTAVSA